MPIYARMSYGEQDSAVSRHENFPISRSDLLRATGMVPPGKDNYQALSAQIRKFVGRELSVTTYLVGELNRRLGNHREALNWYVNAGRTTEGDPRIAWLDRLIDKQRKLAEEQAA